MAFTNSVAVVDLATSSVIAMVPVRSNPTFLTQSPDGAFVYVNNFGDNTTSVIDTATNTVAATLTIGASPANGIAITPDGSAVWTSDGNGVISVIDTATHTITGPTFSALAGDRLFGIVFSPDGALAYLADGTTAQAFVMDAVTHAVSPRFRRRGVRSPTPLRPTGRPSTRQTHPATSPSSTRRPTRWPGPSHSEARWASPSPPMEPSPLWGLRYQLRLRHQHGDQHGGRDHPCG